MRGNFSHKRRENGDVSTGGGNGNGRSSGPSGTAFFESEDTAKSFDNRLNYLLVNGLGSEVEVTVLSGVRYGGVLVGCNPENSNGIDVVLQCPRIVDASFEPDEADVIAATLKDKLVIKAEDVAELKFNGVKMNQEDKIHKPVGDADAKDVRVDSAEFKTDRDISGGVRGKERELQRWVPEDHETFAVGEELEDSAAPWNQFAVNEQKFGIKSTFDEHLYTTKVNKEDPNFAQRLKEADRIAREIESQGGSGNVHLAEERGIVVDDSGLDEEDKYSGVDRRGDELLASLKSSAKKTAPAPKKYLPPTLRNMPHHNDPAIISSVTSTGGSSSGSATVDRAEPSKKVSQTTKNNKNERNNRLEEFKEFSENFKIPYDMPEEVKSLLKKPEESQTSLKVNPSLPPKPVSQHAAQSTATSTSTQSKKSRNAKPPTPSQTKVELRKGSSRLSSQTQSPVSSPSSSRYATIARRRNANTTSFFGSKPPTADRPKKDLAKNFNFFLKSKEAFESTQDGKNQVVAVFFIERPYSTAPTWFSNVDHSYKALFPDERTAIQKSQMKLQQRNMSAMAAAGAPHMMGYPAMMMGMPMAPGGSHSPFVGAPGGAGGMYMPFQPQPSMYHPMMQMAPAGAEDVMSGGSSPSPASPHGTPMFAGASPHQMANPYGYMGSMQFQPMNSGFRQNYHGGRRHRGHDR
ncbi:LAMI_0H08328g1_1 [Lachancea mirantina]|uniref:LAMI_0H08328g1_1 n=1 Tax=Lachancea mirantina TaxID=1230905 RepID=A0A1G4KG18_9SACH|nr:LAMI_0H08328g1_1 [Lachancea mirantina]